jgi:hypothetical protein
MTTTDILVILSGLIVICGIAWFFWGPRQGGARAAVTSSGYQEAMVLVKRWLHARCYRRAAR